MHTKLKQLSQGHTAASWNIVILQGLQSEPLCLALSLQLCTNADLQVSVYMSATSLQSPSFLRESICFTHILNNSGACSVSWHKAGLQFMFTHLYRNVHRKSTELKSKDSHSRKGERGNKSH